MNGSIGSQTNDEQVENAEAIMSAAVPTGQTLHGEYPKLKVVEQAAGAHLSALQQATEFAGEISGKVP